MDIKKSMEMLNPVQRQAVVHKGKSLLILAGAGSGKTRVITVKIAYLTGVLHVDPHSILAVTFTNKASDEMKNRAIDLSPDAANVLIKTFHSFCAWLLRRNAAHLGFSGNFTIYDEDDMVSLLKTLYPKEEKKDLLRWAHLISRAKDYALQPTDDLSIISRTRSFPDVYERYQKRLEEIGNLDFGDLILKTIHLLKNHRQVRERIQQRFTHILVDEYQDSNSAQHELLQQLTGPQTSLCVVGDDDQSIYRFRGAEVRNMLTFPDNFPNTEIIRLEENYRSTKHILSVAEMVVAMNEGRLGKKLWTQKQDGKRPVIVSLNDQDEEASFCLDLLSDGNLGGTAILYRTNAQSRIFESVFSRAGIPYLIVGTVRFYEREEIKDTLAFLRFLVNPFDEISFRRIINKPVRGIGAATLRKLIRYSRQATGGDLVKACREVSSNSSSQQVHGEQFSTKQHKGIASFMTILDTLRDAAEKESFQDFMRKTIKETGLEKYHASQDEVSGTQKMQNLEELINAASFYKKKGFPVLNDFLESVELDNRSIDEKLDPDSTDRVTLITMHNTKGLEFDRVIITGLEQGMFPRGDEQSKADIEEERRLFYVAITRAKSELYFTYCKTRKIYGRMHYLQPSKFLHEIPKDKVDYYSFDHHDIEETPEGEFPEGTGVYHNDYGVGVVVKREFRKGEEVVHVQFETGEHAMFIPEYTSLEKISLESI